MKAKFFLTLAMLLALTLSVQAAEPLLTQPQVEAKAAVVIEAVTGRVVFWQNADQPMPIASTTKIMTAVVALENSPCDKIVSVSEDAVGVEGSSVYLYPQEAVL